MSKAQGITKFNHMLTDFLIDALADKYSDAKTYAYKYNNLKVYMDPNKDPVPHFSVSIGISEATYQISTGKKVFGSLGREDGYVSRWSQRPNVKRELENHWKLIIVNEKSIENKEVARKQVQPAAKKEAPQENKKK